MPLLSFNSFEKTYQLDVLNVILHGFLLCHISQRAPRIPGNRKKVLVQHLSTEREVNTEQVHSYGGFQCFRNHPQI